MYSIIFDIIISLEMVKESKGSSEKVYENRKVIRKGMRFVLVKLLDGIMWNFYCKDLFSIFRMFYE